jgi:hypothetical protein
MEQDRGAVVALLTELGLFHLDSVESIENRVQELNMRQLDRLKMMLKRMEEDEPLFSEEVRKGVRDNDYASFAEAVRVLKSSTK